MGAAMGYQAGGWRLLGESWRNYFWGTGELLPGTRISITGVPYYSNCLAIMYNKDILMKWDWSIPDSSWTWDDFKDMTSQDNHGGDHYGL